MPRGPRIAPGGVVFHVLNRGVGRMRLFEKDADYQAFETVLAQAAERVPGISIYAYCLMPNHWHLVVKAEADGELGRFMHWLTLTHTRRWQEHRQCHGSGHVYQGRYKTFPVQTDEHFLTLCRYVEANALRANLVERAEGWRWSSLWVRRGGSPEQQALLEGWPIQGGVPRQWLRTVNTALGEHDLTALRTSVNKGRPFGGDAWSLRSAKALGLEHTHRTSGRPKKA